VNTLLFSVEETNLMCIFDTANREQLIRELEDSHKSIYDPDMHEICHNVIKKLTNMSDENFASIGLYIADEYTWEEE